MTALLEAGYQEIRAEFTNLLLCGRLKLHPEQGSIAEGDWNIFALSSFGSMHSENCIEAPFTSQLLANLPEVSTAHQGLAYFSVLHPQTHIRPHCGPTNVRIRIHLGLRVPHGAEMRVGSETRSWSEGKCLVFDDSFEHEVFNRGASLRAVLLLDVWHPDLSPQQRRDILSQHGVPTESFQRKRDGWTPDATGAPDVAAALSRTACILGGLDPGKIASIRSTADKMQKLEDKFLSDAATFVLMSLAAPSCAPSVQLPSIDVDTREVNVWTSIAGLFDRCKDRRIGTHDVVNLIHICSLYWLAYPQNSNRMSAFIKGWDAQSKKAFLDQLIACRNTTNIICHLAARDESPVEAPFGAEAALVNVAVRQIEQRAMK